MEQAFIRLLIGRFLKTVRFIKCKFVSTSRVDCLWRRMQTHEQESERQRKTLLQKVMLFKSRADELVVEDGLHSRLRWENF